MFFSHIYPNKEYVCANAVLMLSRQKNVQHLLRVQRYELSPKYKTFTFCIPFPEMPHKPFYKFPKILRKLAKTPIQKPFDVFPCLCGASMKTLRKNLSNEKAAAGLWLARLRPVFGFSLKWFTEGKVSRDQPFTLAMCAMSSSTLLE